MILPWPYCHALELMPRMGTIPYWNNCYPIRPSTPFPGHSLTSAPETGRAASLAGTLKDNATQAKVPAGRLDSRDAVASLEDITAKGPLTLKNVIVLGNPFRFTKDNIDQFDF
jgi:hypothetical protein